MNLSIVIPLLNEEESLPELEAWIRRVMEANNFTYEIVMIDDGSTDTSWEVIERLSKNNDQVRGIKFRRNYGKSAALHTAFQTVRGEVVITMDADLQDNPEEIPDLYRMIKEEKFDIVSGWKKKRHDPLSKTIPTKLYNGVTRMMSGIKLHDMNCGLKAYRNEVVRSIEIYGEMHRYIPVIAKWSGFTNIGEKVVQHQARKFGVTKFGGVQRFIRGPLDLLSITFVGRFGKRPMHFFGTLGILMFIVGFCSAAYIGINKLFRLSNNLPYILVTDNPYFYISLTAMTLGTMLFLTGFLAELVSRNAPHRNAYLIEKEIGNTDG
ncbi:MAG: glycosyltransferase involved in cell wall biosynthesis [Saprospiraceae bacterium]|jgi:glycosyltransferase involved in cell wall biosynthesis